MTPSRNEPTTTVDRIFGKVFRRVRRERNFTQERLALAMRMHPATIGLIERGRRSANIRTLVRAALVMEIQPSEIVARLEKQLGEDLWAMIAAALDSAE